eukprot:gene18999-25582_t
MADKAQWKRNNMAKAGEADRVILTKMPKHVFFNMMNKALLPSKRQSKMFDMIMIFMAIMVLSIVCASIVGHFFGPKPIAAADAAKKKE